MGSWTKKTDVLLTEIVLNYYQKNNCLSPDLKNRGFFMLKKDCQNQFLLSFCYMVCYAFVIKSHFCNFCNFLFIT